MLSSEEHKRACTAAQRRTDGKRNLRSPADGRRVPIHFLRARAGVRRRSHRGGDHLARAQSRGSESEVACSPRVHNLCNHPSHRWIVLFCANARRVDATVRASLASINPFGRRHAVGSPRDSDLGPAGKRGFLGPPTFTLRFADNKFGLPGAWQLAIQRQHDRTSRSLS